MDILSGSVINDTEDIINTTTIFGSVQRTILSKNFKGGRIVNIFGSTELDLTYADINGIAELDISQAFGEITIAVPADWRVEADVAHFCSVVDEERCYANRGYSSNKVLLLKGLSVFAVVDVVNFI
jgi:predicted membrane protein